MQGLDPQQVETKDVFAWFNQAIQLINRRLFSYFISVVIFFISLVAISQAMQLLQNSLPPLILLFAFLFTGAFIFYFFIAALVMISYCADHDEEITPSMIMKHFMYAQRAFILMTLLSLMIGVLYWYLSVLMNPGSDIISMSEKTISLLTNENSVMFYAFKTGSIFLYFLLTVMLFLRTFFSVPLIVFHNLNYHDAKALSHKGLFKNIRPMSYGMMLWLFLFMVSTAFFPVLVIAFMPLFSTFSYVAYRHIFLGQGTNKAAEKHAIMTTA